MNNEAYLSELAAQLQRRDVVDQRINEIITEAENHLTESQESPFDAFGPAALYAEKMAAFSETIIGDNAPEKWHHRTFCATAFDEMETLKWAGDEGWELVDVGALALFCRRPVDMSRAKRWKYKRRTGTHHQIIFEEMAEARWEPCGNWIVFHYFKQSVGGL